MTSQGSPIGRGWIAAAALAFALLLAAAPAARAATGSIAGTVIDAVGKSGVAEVEVCAWSLPDEEELGCAETDSNGDYSITGLAPGEYAVEFYGRARGYHYQAYDGKPTWAEADPVLVGGGVTGGIDAELTPTARIKGTVTAGATGLPVEDVEVCALESTGEETVEAACDYSGEDGSYSLGVEAGAYKIQFWSGRPSNLAMQFYDHEGRWSAADALTVAEGEVRTGVDAALLPAATISGHVLRAATGLPLEEIRVCSIEAAGDALLTCTWTGSDGSYTLHRLPGGTYKIAFSLDLEEWFGFGSGENDGFPTQFWDNQATLAAATPIALAYGAAATGIDARLGPPATPPTIVAPTIVPKPKPKRCRQGFRRKTIRGKSRCVKAHRHRKHHRRGGGASRSERPLLGARP